MEREPRFHGTVTERSHKTMSHIRGKDTKPEIILRKALWNNGIRYRKNYKEIPGRPDIVLTKFKIAVFVDSEFFHGKDWEKKKDGIQRGSNGDYWAAKVERNIERDKRKESELKALGYVVIRFWSRDVMKDTEKCVQAIRDAMSDRLMGDEDKCQL